MVWPIVPGWDRAETGHLAELEPRERRALLKRLEWPGRARARCIWGNWKLRPRKKKFTMSHGASGQRRMSSFPSPFTPHLKHIPLGKVNASFILQPSDSWPSSSLHPTGGRSIRHSTGSTPRQCVVPVESLHLSGHLILGETHCPTLVLRTEGSWGLGSAWGSSC